MFRAIILDGLLFMLFVGAIALVIYGLSKPKRKGVKK